MGILISLVASLINCLVVFKRYQSANSLQPAWHSWVALIKLSSLIDVIMILFSVNDSKVLICFSIIG